MRIIDEVTEENGVPMRCIAAVSYDGEDTPALEMLKQKYAADLLVHEAHRKRIYFMRNV